MIALGVAATWIAISIVGAKGLMVFAHAATPRDFEVDPYTIAAESGLPRRQPTLPVLAVTGEAVPVHPDAASG